MSVESIGRGMEMGTRRLMRPSYRTGVGIDEIMSLKKQECEKQWNEFRRERQ